MIRAVIFDMDDLMINSHSLHIKAFDMVLREYGKSLHDPANPLTKEEEQGYSGMTITDILQLFRKKYDLTALVKVLNDKFLGYAYDLYDKELAPMPGLEDIMGIVKGNFTLAVASSSNMHKISIVLDKFDIRDAFDVVVSGEDDVKKGKPAPDIFLRASQLLSIAPAQCLVLEDSNNGVRAAKAAGMKCIGVHNCHIPEQGGLMQDLHMADIEVNSLKEVTKEMITGL